MDKIALAMWIVFGLVNLVTLYYTRKIEKNTNSKMDQLLVLTEAKGRSDMKQETLDKIGGQQ